MFNFTAMNKENQRLHQMMFDSDESMGEAFLRFELGRERTISRPESVNIIREYRPF